MTPIWLTSSKYIRESKQTEKKGGGGEKFLLNLNSSVEALNISGQSDTQSILSIHSILSDTQLLFN